MNGTIANMTILVVEDEEKLVQILKKALTRERFTVDYALDGEEGLKKALRNTYDVIILDVVLPRRDGFDICLELRSRNIHTPVIMLTARSLIEDRVKGLDMGADDYLVKPFGIEELLARIRSVLRRRKTADGDIWKVADLVLDTKKHELTRAGQNIPLTPKEYSLLLSLISRTGEALSKKELIESAWGPQFKESGNKLNVHIRYLRKKVDQPGMKPLIRTVRGMGFMLKE
ncbi:MAG TPA: response regulator transcription factor [Candidatus Paceibacterota bacterium]|nr:response regulator transcription factor [Candidatus Paceibacterota bacterium]